MTYQHRVIRPAQLYLAGLLFVLPLFSPSGATHAAPTPASAPGRSAAIIAENKLPGTTAWQVTPGLGSERHEIEGFAGATSVNRGGAIDFFVNTIAPSFHIDVYRTGWYGGLGARLMRSLGSFKGMRQAPCSAGTKVIPLVCAWKRTYRLRVPATWLSGVYLAKLTMDPYKRTNGWPGHLFQSYIIFVVRDDSGSSALLFQTSVNTYQAYNHWGGQSLYKLTDASGKVLQPRDYVVSFDRPYDRGLGVGDYFYWEYPMVRWLERNGYDVSYSTDADLDATSPALLARHRAWLMAGHGEYWTEAMRDHLEGALARGLSLGFFSGNEIYLRVRYLSDRNGPRRVITCYKDTDLDPNVGHHNELATVKWRDTVIGRPEQLLIGQMSDSWFNPPSFALRPINTNLWPYAGTGLHNGDSLPGIVGYEYDRVFDNMPKPKGLIILAASPVVNVDGTRSVSNVTLYTASSGARVFAAGTIQWAWGLENLDLVAGLDAWTHHHIASPALQRLSANILDNFVGKR